MKTYLVTGCAGFVGAQTCHELLKMGEKVIGIDNLNNYYDPKLKDYRLSTIEYPHFSFHQIDIENKKALREIFTSQPIDAVINLAARAGVRASIEDPHVYMSTNAIGTLNILELMVEFHIKKMVLASTSSLYAGQEMPFVETLPVNTPISPYAASKKAAEVMSYTYHFLQKLDISVVRYFTVYGPAGRPDMSIFRFIRWIDEGKPIELFGDGTQARDFTHVVDIAKGTIKALKPVGYEIINLGGGQNPVSLLTVIKMIEEHLGKRADFSYKPFHQADIKETWANIDKAESLINWKPEISLEEGIRDSVNWYKANRELCLSLKL